MTWIIGTPTMFGYSFGISDVRVKLGNREIDCLQKIHPVGRFIAAGFAGAVRIGFEMVDELRQLLYSEDERLACDPLLVAREWPQYSPSSAPINSAICRRTCRIASWPGGCLTGDRKSTRLNSSHLGISYAVFCLKKNT